MLPARVGDHREEVAAVDAAADDPAGRELGGVGGLIDLADLDVAVELGPLPHGLCTVCHGEKSRSRPDVSDDGGMARGGRWAALVVAVAALVAVVVVIAIPRRR